MINNCDFNGSPDSYHNFSMISVSQVYLTAVCLHVDHWQFPDVCVSVPIVCSSMVSTISYIHMYICHSPALEPQNKSAYSPSLLKWSQLILMNKPKRSLKLLYSNNLDYKSIAVDIRMRVVRSVSDFSMRSSLCKSNSCMSSFRLLSAVRAMGTNKSEAWSKAETASISR